MVFIALKVTKTFVDAVVLYMMDGLAEDVGHSLAHGSIELHIGREYGYTMLAYSPAVHEIVTSPEDYLYISAKDYTGENGQINIICRMIQVFKSAGMNFFDSKI